MCQINQDLDALKYNVMRLMSESVGHKTDAAGIMFIVRVVEALGRRKPFRWIIFGHFDVCPEYHGRPAL
jgi:hypothetical protein